jgi:hypothetical protein
LPFSGFELVHFRKTVPHRLPKLPFVHHFIGLGLPFVRPQVVIPKALFNELIGTFIFQKLQVGERRFPAELAVVIDDLVFQDSEEPASLGRASGEFLE